MLTQACAEGGLSGDLADTAQLLTSELVTNAVHPVVRSTDDRALDGRGMHIVALLAARWGVTDEPLGKTVWFELSRS
jgi:hypothetical protein